MGDLLGLGYSWDNMMEGMLEYKYPLETGYQFMLVTPTSLPHVWKKVVPLLISTEARWGHFTTLDHIYKGLLGEDLQLWVASNVDAEVFIATLTCLVTYPTMRVLRILWVGGEEIKKVLPMLDYIELWAKAQGAREVIFEGRPGWHRLLGKRGYRLKAHLFGKDISNLTVH